ncbi:MAG: hypothetical protein RL757_3228 [Bacteroidota bacterium]|jgi:putative oxidoreductase
MMKDLLDLFARICISIIFFFEAYDKLWFQTATKINMTQHGLSGNQDLLMWGGCLSLILGAFLILIGYRTNFGAILILAYWIPLTIMLNQFWIIEDHDLRRNISLHFMKNIAIVGALLMLLINGSGKYSVKKLLATTRVRTF